MTRPAQRGRLLSTEVVTASVLALFGVGYGAQAVQEGVGSLGEPGPGFFPLLVAVALVLACAVVLRQELRSAVPAAPATATSPEPAATGDAGEAEDEEPLAWGRTAGVLLAALVVPLLGTTVGFVVTLSVAVVAIAKVMGMPGLLRPAALGVGFGVAVWAVFVYWLFVPLPEGVLGLA